jgi:hypothetical protein
MRRPVMLAVLENLFKKADSIAVGLAGPLWMKIVPIQQSWPVFLRMCVRFGTAVQCL